MDQNGASTRSVIGRQGKMKLALSCVPEASGFTIIASKMFNFGM